jgi:drug/metabolite transporter (DMT)-like permease
MLSRGWFILSLMSAVMYSISSNVIFYLGKLSGGYNMNALNFAIYTVVAVVIAPALALVASYSGQVHGQKRSLFQTFADSKMLKDYNPDIRRAFSDPKILFPVLLAAVATVFANICLYSAYASSTNPGMCDAVSSSCAFVSLLLSAAVMHSSIDGTAVFGMILMAIAGWLIVA